MLRAGVGANLAIVTAYNDMLSAHQPYEHFPELIRQDMVPAAAPLKSDSVLGLPFTGLGTASFDGAEIGMPNAYDEVYHDGVAKGDPNLSSAETGAALSEKLTDIVARFAVHFASRVPA